jgi:mercuric ion transport protein
VKISKVSNEGAAKLSLGGAMLAALAAASCCAGPLVLGALGLGSAGAFVALAAYRPHILGATVLLLVLGFYWTYRKPRAVEGDACGCKQPAAGRAARVALWTATMVAGLFAATPAVLASVMHRRPMPQMVGQDLEQAVLQVRGIDCEACAAPMQRALAKVGGFRDLRLDIVHQTVTVIYEPAVGRLDAYVAALNDLGYEASAQSIVNDGRDR